MCSDASSQCQRLTEQGERTWQLAYGAWGGALALPVCIHQSVTQNAEVGGGADVRYILKCSSMVFFSQICCRFNLFPLHSMFNFDSHSKFLI